LRRSSRRVQDEVSDLGGRGGLILNHG
jgi:hypothetical protein